MINRAEQIGNLTPIELRATATSAELRALLARHMESRPDHLVCLHPNATPAMRKTFTDWADKKAHLEIQLTMALAAEENAWKDATGNTVTPAPWQADPTAYVTEQRRKAAEMKAYHERRAAGTTKANGRPRNENPSPDALRCRANRAKKKAAA
jgi:hypothetical protein